mgnify:FL=1
MPHIHAPRKATETMEGAGVTVRRLMPVPQFMNFDPFVLWDHFEIGPDTGFPDHPHRGFEAITYMFTGSMQHTDNLGNQSTVTAGGAQRFTAGRRIVHSEMPADTASRSGIQLWLNLPQRLKHIEPAYQQVGSDGIPERHQGQVVVRDIFGMGSPLHLHTRVRYADVTLDAGEEFAELINKDFRGFIYLVEGELVIAGRELDAGYAAFMEDTGLLKISAKQKSRFMICFGAAHHEPIKQYGPFVD